MAVLTVALYSSAQTRTVTGTVIDGESSDPLVGASVVPVGSTGGVVTDVDGHFTLVISSKVKEIKVSYVGMQTATVPVSDNMNIALQPSAETLETLVVTGYGSAKKIGSVVGSVSVVGEAQLETTPTPTFIDALQGQVAGLSILSDSGEPSSTDNSVRIRGVNSLNGGNTPLYILDGAPVTSTVFTTLNPADIENVTVLKDAASLSIYGSRAANGVIVITSKKGKYAQKPRFTLRATVGWSNRVSDKLTMMDSKQNIEFMDMIGQPVSQEIKDLVNNYGISTNWADYMFNTAPQYSVEGALQGGSDYVNYYLSFNHMDQEGIMVASGMRRETLRASLEGRVNDWFKVGFQGNLGYTKYESNIYTDQATNNVGNPVFFARLAKPYDSPYYYSFGPNGEIIYGERAEYLKYTGMTTPQYIQDNYYTLSRNRVTFNGALFEQITPINGLTIRAQQSVDAYDSRLGGYYKPMTILVTPMGDVYDPGVDPDTGIAEGRAQQSFSRYYQFTYTNTAEYRFNLKNLHNFSFLIGEESIIGKSDLFGLLTEGQTDIRQMLLTQGTSVTMDDISQSVAQVVSNSIFANASYDFDDRYFLDLSFRRDGSSKFAPGHRWANFFAIGAMWNLKNEKFLQEPTWLNDLRFRVSYGTTGNTSGIGNYAYFGLLGSYRNPYNGSPAIGIAQPSNYDLTWETVRSTDVGLSFSIFNRLSGDIDFYHKKTVDMLMSIPYSFTTGFSAGAGNIASMTNTGVDVDLNANIINTQDWTWGVKVNFNYNKNKITSLFNGRDYYTLTDTGIRYEVGHDAGEFYYVRYAGVDPRDGRQLWYDANGNLTKVYNEEANSVMLGKSQYAPWSGGFGTDLRWKWFSLHVDFMWEAQKYMLNNDRYFIENTNFANQLNQMTTMLDVWTHPGQITDIPKVGEEIQFDTHLLEDASFLRMKNLTFQYTMPRNLVSKAGFENVAFRFTGRNLLTATKFTGYDPEPGSNLVTFWYPNTRQYEFGVDITF